ncbi:unnamed protein product [Linum trigynum]|uniref:BTB domain-containing protein n=1 Tax=Linum trigynum TaxID=586398 RepID=A0AAV2EN54_9ROSI
MSTPFGIRNWCTLISNNESKSAEEKDYLPVMVGQSEPEKHPWRSCASKSVVETVTGSHKFIVEGYSLMKGMGTDNDDGGTGIHALIDLRFLDKSEKEGHHGRETVQRGVPETIKKGRLWGYICSEAVLARRKYLHKDCIVIEGTVGVVTTRHEQVEGAKQDDSITVPDFNLGNGFKELLESEVGWDVVFRVGDETFRAHKSILAARSPLFRAQFFGLARDPYPNEVIVDDVHPSIFKAMLLFIYTDELPDVHDTTSSSRSSTSEATNTMQHLLVAADMYNLDRLKVFCESKLSEEITALSVATTLALAEQHYCAQLKAVCLKFAVHPPNLRVMMQSEGFKHLEESCPTLLRELLKTVASTDEDRVMAESINPNKRLARKRFWFRRRHA